MAYTSHGHYIVGSPKDGKRPPKYLGNCGGPGFCGPCSLEATSVLEANKIKNARPSWDEWGLELAKAVALRADCTRRKVGAVIMTPDHTIVSTGYNGGRPNGPSCLAGQCPRGQMSKDQVAPGSSYDTGAGTCIALHAEQNAILRCTWELMKGSVMYITDKPCDGCMRMINGTPIDRIHYPQEVTS